MASASCRGGCRQTVPPGAPCGSPRSCRRCPKVSISIAISSPDSLSSRFDLRRRDYFLRKPILRIKCCSAGPDENPSGNSVTGASEKIELGVDEVAPYLLRRFEQDQSGSGIASVIGEAMPTRDFVTLSACVVGLLTGVSVVLFNTAVHEIRDFFWDGLPLRGASWLREEPIEKIWQRVVLVPACGGVIVGMLNSLRSSLKETPGVTSSVKEAMRPLVKAIAASVTLGTANSLGPEGPSVEIGSSIAKGIGQLLGLRGGKSLSLVAAGSAAGISSGFNAAVAGCFFAVESVLWPSTTDSFFSLSNSTSMVILSSVIASVVSEVGLGSEPTFTVPDYDFRSPSELPLYLLLGVLCGIVSVTLSGCTSLALEVVDYLQRVTGVTKAIFPALGGLIVGLIALSYPEILYWGFENVDILLESRPFVNSLPTDILFQLVGVKIFATSLSRASGLAGGYYAPSLFIGAATGMAYGKFMSSTFCGPNPLIHLSALEVASPQAYGLVGMAATLAGVCQVPLTSVLLLFELTQDYRIVLPLLGAVGISSWITSRTSIKRKAANKSGEAKGNDLNVPRRASLPSESQNNDYTAASAENNDIDLCEIETSLCVYDISAEVSSMAHKLTVAEAMRIKFLSMPMNTSVIEAVTLMQTEKQSCVVIIDGAGFSVGLLLLEEIQSFLKSRTTRDIDTEVNNILVSDICHVEGGECKTWTATPEMELLAAKYIMDLNGVDHLPVVSESSRLVGLLDRECISIAFRAQTAKGYLSLSSTTTRLES